MEVGGKECQVRRHIHSDAGERPERMDHILPLWTLTQAGANPYPTIAIPLFSSQYQFTLCPLPRSPPFTAQFYRRWAMGTDCWAKLLGRSKNERARS